MWWLIFRCEWLIYRWGGSLTAYQTSEKEVPGLNSAFFETIVSVIMTMYRTGIIYILYTCKLYTYKVYTDILYTYIFYTYIIYTDILYTDKRYTYILYMLYSLFIRYCSRHENNNKSASRMCINLGICIYENAPMT